MAHAVTPLVCPIVIARQPELAAVERFLDGTGGPVMLVSGEAGIGKSRLVAEGGRLADERGLQVLRGACFAPDRGLPFAPFVDLLRALSRSRMLDQHSAPFPSTIAELQELLPELSVGPPARAPVAVLEPAQRKKRIFYALSDLFTALARTEPVLLILEDLHWSDETSLEFLSYLARHLDNRPIRLLLSYRSDESHSSLTHFVADLQRERLARELALARLSPGDVTTMVRAILGTDPLPPRVYLDHLYRLTDGNPFFIEEILASLARVGDDAASSAEGRWSRDAIPIPRTVHDAIQQRLTRLKEPARQLLTLAAVAGRRFDFTLLRELTRHDDEQLLRLIDELIRENLVIEETTDRYSFRHALTREAVYLDRLARERRLLHRAIGEAMERLAGENPETPAADLAYHFSQAEDWPKALEYARRAGEQALRMYAPFAALDHLSHAIATAGKVGGTVSPRLYRGRGQAYEILGDFDRAHSDFASTAELARVVGDRRAEWEAVLDLGHLWSSRDYARTGAYIRQALDLARTLDDPALVAYTLNHLGNWHCNREEVSCALPYHREALTIFEHLGDRRGVAETLDVLGMSETIGSHLQEATVAWERAIPLLRTLDDRPRLIVDLTMWMLMTGLYWSDTLVPVAIDRAAATQAGQEALRIARSFEFRAGEAFVLYELGLWHGPRGEYARGLAAAAESHAICEEIKHQEWLVGALSTLGALHLDLLNLAVARRHLERAYAVAQEIASSNWIRLTASVLAPTYLHLGELDRASTLLNRVIDQQTPLETLGQRRCWCARGELYLAIGEPARALDCADRLIASAPDASTGRAAPRLAMLRGAALLALARTDEAEAVLHQGRDEALALHWQPTAWRIDVALGRLYHRQGRRLAARQAYGAARATIEDLATDLPDESVRATFLRGALRQLPPLRPPSPRGVEKEAFGGLTARERDVARRIAEGKSNRAIAEDLVVAERTVEGYVSSILDKLGFTARAQIAGWAVAKGLVREAD